MQHFEIRRSYDLNLGQFMVPRFVNCLEIDDLVCRARDDLGLEVDEAGYLVLTRGKDPE